MERTINNNGKRKAEQREGTNTTTTTTRRHRLHHPRIDAPRFIGIRETTIPTSREGDDDDDDVVLARPFSRPVTPRQRVDVSSSLRERRQTTMTPPPSTTSYASAACLASLPLELFCNVVAYLGPTSTSLCSLCQVSRHHNVVMTSIGDVMLHRARLRFRVPLPPMTTTTTTVRDGVVVVVESSVSLFVRHARASKAVHDCLEVLDAVSRKEFPSVAVPPFLLTDGDHRDDASSSYPTDLPTESFAAIPRRISDPSSSSSYRDRGSGRRDSATIVEPSEVANALNVALCLLGCPDRDYFDDPDEASRISNHASTTALEWRVSSLCGTIGAMSYRYAKSRMCRRYEREDEMFVAYHAVTDRMMLRRPLPEDDSDYDDDDGDDDDDDDDASIDASEMEAEGDMLLLDKASLVMQHVFLREQEMDRRRSQFFLR
jgi:hypothetical protein